MLSGSRDVFAPGTVSWSQLSAGAALAYQSSLSVQQRRAEQHPVAASECGCLAAVLWAAGCAAGLAEPAQGTYEVANSMCAVLCS